MTEKITSFLLTGQKILLEMFWVNCLNGALVFPGVQERFFETKQTGK